MWAGEHVCVVCVVCVGVCGYIKARKMTITNRLGSLGMEVFI